MGIYNRDNIPYQSMIESMLRTRAEDLAREKAYMQKRADLVNAGVNMLGRGFDTYRLGNYGSELEEKLKKLQAERASLLNQKMDAIKAWEDPAGADSLLNAALLKRRDTNPYATPDNLDANMTDYFNYLMNGGTI